MQKAFSHAPYSNRLLYILTLDVTARPKQAENSENDTDDGSEANKDDEIEIRFNTYQMVESKQTKVLYRVFNSLGPFRFIYKFVGLTMARQKYRHIH